jgi:ABC-2 type transport system permease protein
VAILAVTFVQSITILVIGAAVFNVDWGNPAAAGALVVATNLAAAAAGVCIGAFGRNPDRTAALAPILGIALAIIGGCILPLELFPASLRAVAHGVPQYWAVSAWQQLIFDGAHTANIAASLAVLLTSAAALFALAIASFTRELRHVRA